MEVCWNPEIVEAGGFGAVGLCRFDDDEWSSRICEDAA